MAQSSRSAADLVQTTPIPARSEPESSSEPAAASEMTPTPSSPAPGVPGPAPAPAPTAALAAAAIDARQAHQNLAVAHALRYFRYEFRTGSNAISVTDSDVEIEETAAVPGWNQYRTKGKVFLEIYDSVGCGSFSRRALPFEVLTEQKPGQEIKVIDFSRR